MIVFYLILIQFVIFVALVVVLRKILYSASSQEVGRLQRLNQENAKRQKELTEKIAEADKYFEESKMKAEDQARDIEYLAKKEAKGKAEEITAVAKKEADEMVKRARNAKEEMRKEVEKEFLPQSTNMALKILKKSLVAEEIQILHKSILSKSFKEIKNIPEKSLYVDKSVKKIDVYVAFVLDAQDKKKLTQLLSSCIGRNISLEETVDKSIVAGLKIHIGNIVMDSNILRILKETAEKIKKSK